MKTYLEHTDYYLNSNEVSDVVDLSIVCHPKQSHTHTTACRARGTRKTPIGARKDSVLHCRFKHVSFHQQGFHWIDICVLIL